MLEKTAAAIRTRPPELKSRFDSKSYRAEFKLDSNLAEFHFLVLCFEIMPFSQTATGEKESVPWRLRSDCHRRRDVHQPTQVSA
jgi:hypothetical protein